MDCWAQQMAQTELNDLGWVKTPSSSTATMVVAAIFDKGLSELRNRIEDGHVANYMINSNVVDLPVAHDYLYVMLIYLNSKLNPERFKKDE